MNNIKQHELWRLAQVAFDEERSPADDAQILDLLLDDPDLMEAFDEVLMVESKLGDIANLPKESMPTLPRFRRARLATAVAALLIASLPFLTSETPQQGSSRQDPGAVSIAEGDSPNIDQVNAPDGEQLAKAETPQVSPKSAILSFELSVSQTTPALPKAREPKSLSDSPRPQIRTLTSTRSKSVLGNRTR